MIIKEIKTPLGQFLSTTERVLTNRGIALKNVHHYLNTTDEDINSPLLLGEELLREAAKIIFMHLAKNDKILVVVDADCDGFTSSAILINYLKENFPSLEIDHFLHDDKTHGLIDCYKEAEKYDLVILPDASTNDVNYHSHLIEHGVDVIVLDHHLSEGAESKAVIINNQTSDYPNKEFSGAGVVWQFCRYLDILLNKNLAMKYVDLVAVGLTADMMNLQEFETRHVVKIGLQKENLHNPLILEMFEKNKFSIGDTLTPMGVAFYIAPFINAMTRSGELWEKELLFKGMLQSEAYERVPSTKRGHKIGEEETIVEQAVRVSVNVKNRQAKSLAVVGALQEEIYRENMLEHSVLLFVFDEKELNKNVAGLLCNKLMAMYQRPVCVLIDKGNVLQGSARGYDMGGITDFKGLCMKAPGVTYALGHNSAFGLSIEKNKFEQFIQYMDIELKEYTHEPCYYVDFLFEGAGAVDPEPILTIGGLKDLWGRNMSEPFIAIKGLKVSEEMVTIYRKKNNTIKISLPNGVSIMKFFASEDETMLFKESNTGFIKIDLVGKCQANEWNGNVTPQILIEAYEVTQNCEFDF